MKRVTLKSEAHLDCLDPAKVEEALEILAAKFAEISVAASGGTLDLHLVLRGEVFSDAPGAIVAAHGAIDDALADASDEVVKTDLSVNSIREPRAAKSEKGGEA